MSKTAIVVFADPGTEEALGRVVNALILAQELKDKEQEVAVIFQGAGVRWLSEIVSERHPANGFYVAVEDKVVGACGGCAEVFGAYEAIEKAGGTLIAERAIPGTSGVIDLSAYLDNGYRLATF